MAKRIDVRDALYSLARLMGDVRAVRKGRVLDRVARRTTGRAASRFLSWLHRG